MMNAWKPPVACDFIQSLKINPRTPAPISISNNRARNIAYAARRHVFSRNAPTHPVKPMINVTVPTRMRINAGSSATFVRRDRLLKVSFSVHAQTPTAMMPKPSHQNMTLNPKITYLRQQLTSLVSLRYFRTAGMAERHLSTDRANSSHTCRTDTTHRERTVNAWRRRRELRSHRGGSEGTHCIIHILREEKLGAHHLRVDHESDDMASGETILARGASLSASTSIGSFFGTPARVFYLSLSLSWARSIS